MNRQRDTKTRRRPPWVSGTGNQSQYINELYPDTSEMMACSDTTQTLRPESVPTTGASWTHGTKVDAFIEAPAWYPNTSPNHDTITGMIALQTAPTRIEGGMSSTLNTFLHQEATPKDATSTLDIPASYAGALEVPSSMSSVHRGDVINGWPMNNPGAGYYSGGYSIEGGLNPGTIATINLVPASQHGESHGMEVGPAFREYHSLTPGAAAITGSQSGPSTSGLTLITDVGQEDTEGRNAISTTTLTSTSQSLSYGVIENSGMIRGHMRRGLPAEEFEDDISKLTHRLAIQGADRAVVELCSAIFAQGVSLEALKAQMTRNECEKHGLRSGMRYRMLLDVVRMDKAGISMVRHVCRLCRHGEASDYKHHRDALRHFLRDHFGMGFQCTQWSAFPFAVRSGYR